MFPNWERGSDGLMSLYMTGAAEQKHDLCVMKEVSKAVPLPAETIQAHK